MIDLCFYILPLGTLAKIEDSGEGLIEFDLAAYPLDGADSVGLGLAYIYYCVSQAVCYPLRRVHATDRGLGAATKDLDIDKAIGAIEEAPDGGVEGSTALANSAGEEGLAEEFGVNSGELD